jgi:hypothetical protein
MQHTDRWFTILTVFCISNKEQDNLCITSGYIALCTAATITAVSNSRAPYTLSVKPNGFIVWLHTWQINWVNCAVLTYNSGGLRTVLSSRLSHRELRSSLRESHRFLSLPADTTMASSQGIQSIQQMSIAWYIPFKILLTPHLTLSFLLFG